ncbi:MAG: hypothetical protein ACRDXX_20575, partial [Stackebrandtia sp.]
FDDTVVHERVDADAAGDGRRWGFSDDRLPTPKQKGELATRRERRIAERGGKESGGIAPLLLVGGVAVTLILLVAVGGLWLVTNEEEPLGEESPAADGVRCDLDEYSVECMETPLCFEDALVDDAGMAAAKEISCEQEHRWEAYAKGQLPADVEDATYLSVRQTDIVKETCLSDRAGGPLESIVGASVDQWSSDVLPPSKEDFEADDRTFFCVAERSDGPSTGSAFGPS